MEDSSCERRWEFHSLDLGVWTIAEAAREFTCASSKAPCENLKENEAQDSKMDSRCDICWGSSITVKIRKTGGARKVHFDIAAESDCQSSLPEPDVRSTSHTEESLGKAVCH